MNNFARWSVSMLSVSGLLAVVGCAAESGEETASASAEALSKLSCSSTTPRVASLAACQALVTSTAGITGGANGQDCADGAATTTKYSDCEDLGFKGLITVRKTVCKCNKVEDGVWSLSTSEQTGYSTESACKTGCSAASLPTSGSVCAPIGSTGTVSCSCTPSGFGSGGPTGWKRFFAKPVCVKAPVVTPPAEYHWLHSSFEQSGYSTESACNSSCVQSTLPDVNSSCTAAELNVQKKSCSCTPSGFGSGGPTGWKQYYSVRTCRQM